MGIKNAGSGLYPLGFVAPVSAIYFAYENGDVLFDERDYHLSSYGCTPREQFTRNIPFEQLRLLVHVMGKCHGLKLKVITYFELHMTLQGVIN